jgi:hypothetical protein
MKLPRDQHEFASELTGALMLYCCYADASADLDAAPLVLLDAGPLFVPALPLDQIASGPASRADRGAGAASGTTDLEQAVALG